MFFIASLASNDHDFFPRLLGIWDCKFAILLYSNRINLVPRRINKFIAQNIQSNVKVLQNLLIYRLWHTPIVTDEPRLPHITSCRAGSNSGLMNEPVLFILHNVDSVYLHNTVCLFPTLKYYALNFYQDFVSPSFSYLLLS